MKICLINGPRYNLKPVRKTSLPLSLACLAASARKAGHEVFGIDGILVGDPRQIARQAAAGRPDVVGVTTTTNDRFAALAAIRAIREALPGAFIVVGGPHFSYTAQNALRVVPQIDAVVVGEGEATLLELLARLPDRQGLDQVAGLVFRDADGQIVANAPREALADLDRLPMPAWDLFPMDSYEMHMIDSRATPTMGIMTTRGCPYQCCFCANSLDRKLRCLSPSLAVDQLQYLQTRHGMNGFSIFDDAFLAKTSHAVALCEEILKRNLKFTWWCGARAANLDPDVLKLMRRAGCAAISFGVETGTDEVLAASHKNNTCRKMVEAFEVAARADFEQIQIFLIIGLPGETAETIDRTQVFLNKLRGIVPDAWRCHSMIGQLPLIYPGTELESLGKAQGCIAEDFSWNSPYVYDKRHLPLTNSRYWAVPHFETRQLPLETLCRHVGKHYWNELPPGSRRRYRLWPIRRIAQKIGLL